MAVRGGLIECPHCGNHVQDTKQEYIDCRFCGKRFKRGTVGKEKEEELRRNMVMDLSDKIQKMKAVIFAGKIVGLIFLVLGIILLFSDALTLIQILLMVIFFACAGVWLSLVWVYSNRMEKDQSKMFDLSGGRDVFEY
jgi:Flp pilus assembly protein TadB